MGGLGEDGWNDFVMVWVFGWSFAPAWCGFVLFCLMFIYVYTPKASLLNALVVFCNCIIDNFLGEGGFQMRNLAMFCNCIIDNFLGDGESRGGGA